MKHSHVRTLIRVRRKAIIRQESWLGELVRVTLERRTEEPRLPTVPFEWDAPATEEWLRQVGFEPANGSSGAFHLEWTNLADQWGNQRARANTLCRTIAKQFDDRLAAGGSPVPSLPTTRIHRPVRSRTREFL